MGTSCFIFVLLLFKFDNIFSLNVSAIVTTESLAVMIRNINMEVTRSKELTGRLQHEMSVLKAHNTNQHNLFKLLQNETEIMQQNISILQEENRKQRLLIQQMQDNSGLIQRHVAFTAQNSNNLPNLGNGQTIKFDNIVTNVGGRYSAGTGVFTADISGMYAFTFIIRVFDNNHVCWTDLVKDDNRVVISWAKGDPEKYGLENGGNFALVHLSVGNSVWLKNIQYESFGCSIDDLSSFSGFLLYPD